MYNIYSDIYSDIYIIDEDVHSCLIIVMFYFHFRLEGILVDSKEMKSADHGHISCVCLRPQRGLTAPITLHGLEILDLYFMAHS